MSHLIIVPLFRLNPLAAGLNLSASLKADNSNKEMEEAMKRVREAQSLISAAIEPGSMYRKAVLFTQQYVDASIFCFCFFLMHFHVVVLLFYVFILQTKKARSALGLVRGPDPGGGGPDLARGTGEDCRADRLVVVCKVLTIVCMFRCRRSRSRSRRRSTSRNRRRSRSPRRKRTRSRDRGRRSHSRSRCVAAAAAAAGHLIHERPEALRSHCTLCPQG